MIKYTYVLQTNDLTELQTKTDLTILVGFLRSFNFGAQPSIAGSHSAAY